MKMAAALSQIDASRTWAMTDMDQLHPLSPKAENRTPHESPFDIT